MASTRLKSAYLPLLGALVVAAWTLSFSAESMGHAILITLLALLNVYSGFRFQGEPRTLFVILLGVPYALWLRSVPARGFVGYAALDLPFIAGFYAQGLAMFLLFFHTTPRRRQFALAATVFSFAVAGVAPRNSHFLWMAIVILAMVMLAVRQELGVLAPRFQWRRGLKYALALAVLVSLAGAIEIVTTRNMSKLNRWVLQQMISRHRQPSAGFSRYAQLGAIPEVWATGSDMDVALRVWTREPSTHLRGAAFNIYRQGSWRALDENHELQPQEEMDVGRYVFDLAPEAGPTGFDGTPPPLAMVHPAAAFSESVFLPLGTRHVGLFARRVYIGEALTVRLPRREAAGGYRYYQTIAMPAEPEAVDLEVEETIAEPLERLVATILGSHEQTPATASASIAAWFTEHFTYQIGFPHTPDKDPVIAFLEDVRAGHCEYFASAGTLLLRASGVPARYVTGFVCQEAGAVAGLHLARRKDAHAWVEYHDPARGWVTFDPTPASAQPRPTELTGGERWWEWIRSWFDRMYGVIRYGGVQGVIGVLWAVFTDAILAVHIWVWIIIAVAASLWVFRDNIFRRRRRDATLAVSARAVALQANLQKAQTLLNPHGLTLEPGMTVSAYRRRMDDQPLPPDVQTQAASLLDAYQAERFRPD